GGRGGRPRSSGTVRDGERAVRGRRGEIEATRSMEPRLLPLWGRSLVGRRRRVPVGSSEHSLEDFADGVLRQFLTELDLGNALHLADPRVAIFVELLRSDLSAGPRDDQREGGLAPSFARDTDDGDLGDARVRREHGLEVGGVNVEAARNDDVLLPVEQIQKAVFVEATEIAGPEVE